ncbi:MAG: hypothetical protein ACM34I_09935 [bacterium]
MLICYLCGNLQKEETENGGIDCPKCHVHYCTDCTQMVSACYSCGKTLDTATYPGNHSSPREAARSSDPNRKYIRKEFTATIEYFSAPLSKSTFALKAITNNISASGLCMFTMDHISEGQVIYFPKSFRLGNHTSAVVRWVKKISDTLYSAGLMFQEHSPR